MAADELSILSLGAVLPVAHASDRNGKRMGAMRNSLGKCILASRVSAERSKARRRRSPATRLSPSARSGPPPQSQQVLVLAAVCRLRPERTQSRWTLDPFSLNEDRRAGERAGSPLFARLERHGRSRREDPF